MNARKHFTHSKWLEKHMTIKTCYSQMTNNNIHGTSYVSYGTRYRCDLLSHEVNKGFWTHYMNIKSGHFYTQAGPDMFTFLVSGHMVQRICAYIAQIHIYAHTHVLSCSLLSWESEKIAFAHILMLDPFLLHTQLRLNVKLCCRYSQNQKCTFWLFSSQLMHHIICQRHTLIFPKSWSVYK